LTVGVMLLAAAVVVYLVIDYWLQKRRDLCYSCHTFALKVVNFLRVNPGPSYSLHRCDACGATYKHVNGHWIYLSAEEWSKEPSNQPEPKWRAPTQSVPPTTLIRFSALHSRVCAAATLGFLNNLAG
jgi:hypothetical protein